MSDGYCMTCRKQVPLYKSEGSYSSFCSDCGSTDVTLQIPEPSSRPRRATTMRSGCGIALGVVGGVIVLGGIFGGGDPPRGTSPGEPSRLDIAAVCQHMVQKRLKAPRTAKFEWGALDSVRRVGADHFVMSSWVDSQNSFGAMLRTRFTCVVKDDLVTVHLH